MILSDPQTRLLGFLAACEHASVRQCASAVYGRRPHRSQVATINKVAFSLERHGLVAQRQISAHGFGTPWVWEITDAGRALIASTHPAGEDEP